jgi:hypothetical protein
MTSKPNPRIKVLNRHHGPKPDGHSRIYIGRGSPLGNPYSHIRDSQAKFLVSTREEAIAEYKDWLPQQVAAGNRSVLAALEHIAQRSLEGGVDLICFCVPKSCHGEVIRDLVVETILSQLSQPEGKDP